MHLPSTFCFPSPKRKTCLITDLGAVSDTTTINSTFIQKDIDQCAKDGGETVVIPKVTYISGTVFMKEKVNFQIETGGTTALNVTEFDSNYKRAVEQFAFIFHVHRKGENLGLYNDGWITDTLKSQIKINKPDK